MHQRFRVWKFFHEDGSWEINPLSHLYPFKAMLKNGDWFQVDAANVPSRSNFSALACARAKEMGCRFKTRSRTAADGTELIVVTRRPRGKERAPQVRLPSRSTNPMAHMQERIDALPIGEFIRFTRREYDATELARLIRESEGRLAWVRRYGIATVTRLAAG